MGLLNVLYVDDVQMYFFLIYNVKNDLECLEFTGTIMQVFFFYRNNSAAWFTKSLKIFYPIVFFFVLSSIISLKLKISKFVW